MLAELPRRRLDILQGDRLRQGLVALGLPREMRYLPVDLKRADAENYILISCLSRLDLEWLEAQPGITYLVAGRDGTCPRAYTPTTPAPATPVSGSPSPRTRCATRSPRLASDGPPPSGWPSRLSDGCRPIPGRSVQVHDRRDDGTV